MFALRNKGDETCILALAEGLKSKNALFRHEIAYVLGQIQSPLVTNQLLECLRDENEMDMVRNPQKDIFLTVSVLSVLGTLKCTSPASGEKL